MPECGGTGKVSLSTPLLRLSPTLFSSRCFPKDLKHTDVWTPDTQVFPQTPQDSLHLSSPHWWHGLLLGQVDCAGSVSRLRVVETGNSGTQAIYHYVGLKLGHRLWVGMPLALLSLLTVKDYGCRGIRADPLKRGS